MKPYAELSEWLEEAINSYCGEASEEPPYLKRLAAQWHALPVMIGWTEFWGVKPNGEVWVVATEGDEKPQVESDARMRRMALFQGTKKYPKLKPLVPSRPLDAVACSHCGGSGRVDVPGVEPGVVICYCGGLGWLTSEDDSTHQLS